MYYLAAARLLPSQIMQDLHNPELLFKGYGAGQVTTNTASMLLSAGASIG